MNTTGCFTERYYLADRASHFYQEDINSFLITDDGTKLVVLGNKYHYIFELSQGLEQILTGSLKQSVSAKFTVFYVTRDNKISGNCILSLSDTAVDELKKTAINLGFTYNGKPNLSLSRDIQGTRYSAEGFPEVDKRYRFNDKYIISIREEQSAAELASNIVITPILVTADGLLFLGAASLYIFTYGVAGGGL